MNHYSEKAAAKMAKRMIQALAYCHKQNMVHRDLYVRPVTAALDPRRFDSRETDVPCFCSCLPRRKPENYVFETEEDASEMRLIDFGCAKIVTDEDIYRDMAGTRTRVFSVLLWFALRCA